MIVMSHALPITRKDIIVVDLPVSDNCLTNPPRTGDALVDANLLAFWYYMHHWLSNREQALLWNHYDRDEPRTTNHAEGYHRRGLAGL